MSLIDAIREKQARIASLREEISALEAELQEASALLQGRVRLVGHIVQQPKGSVDRPKSKSRHGFTNGVRRKPIQPGSSVHWTQRVLTAVGSPMTVDEIINNIEAMGGPAIKKPTLVSNLSRYVKHKDTFVHTGQSTYGLIGQETSAPSLLEQK
jgi:hypothetical protein